MRLTVNRPSPPVILIPGSGVAGGKFGQRPTTPYEVVDGKQRLTTILRFVGRHPVATQKVAEVTARHKDKKFNDQGRLDIHGGKSLTDLFHHDYPAFRRAWKALEGYALNATQENEYYFPFKLRASGEGGLVGSYLEPLRGKYYTQIKNLVIRVAAEEVTIKGLFEEVVEYRIPVIEYTKASQAQIHEVFKLYNKQGVHLNAEEIRNAVYHEVELTRATLAAAGDADPNTDVAKIAESLAGIPNLDRLSEALKGYGFGDTRYKRTKVLAWVISVLVHDTAGKDLPSTSRNIDQLLIAIQKSKSHRLANSSTLNKLFSLLVQAVELHSSHDELWSDQFKDGGKGAKWQELQLVGSLVGIAMALAASPDDIEERIEAKGDVIRTASEESADWERPEKTQTKTQWDYIARISKNLLELLDIDPDHAAEAVRTQFGTSGYEHATMANEPPFTTKFGVTFVRGYDMADPAVEVLRRDDLINHQHVDAQSVTFRVDLPATISLNNPLVGARSVVEAILRLHS